MSQTQQILVHVYRIRLSKVISKFFMKFVLSSTLLSVFSSNVTIHDLLYPLTEKSLLSSLNHHSRLFAFTGNVPIIRYTCMQISRHRIFTILWIRPHSLYLGLVVGVRCHLCSTRVPRGLHHCYRWTSARRRRPIPHPYLWIWRSLTTRGTGERALWH